MSRFQLLPQPQVAPGTCISCGSGTKPVVDFGVSIDWHGAVYFCVDCLTEAGVEIGLVTQQEFQRNVEELAKVLDVQHAVIDRIKEYNERQLALSNDLDADITSIYGSSSGSTQERIEFPTDEPPNDPEPEPVARKSRKSAGEQRSSSVPADRSNEDGSIFGI